MSRLLANDKAVATSGPADCRCCRGLSRRGRLSQSDGDWMAQRVNEPLEMVDNALRCRDCLRALEGVGPEAAHVLKRQPGLIVYVVDIRGLAVLQRRVAEFPIHIAVVSRRDERADVSRVRHFSSPESFVEIAACHQFHSTVRPSGKLAIEMRMDL